MRLLAPFALVLAAPLLAACASDPAPVTVQSVRGVETRAVVQSVDQQTRQILLRFEDGSIGEVTAGPEVRNLAQLEAGDTVVAIVDEIITARLATPSDPERTVTSAAGERAAVGDKPGVAVASGLATVVRFVSYDAATGQATFLTPEGQTVTRTVAPDLREFAAARRAGDRIYVEVIDLFAIGVSEVAG